MKTLAKVEVAEGGVYAVALSPNGDRVAAAGGDGTVRLYRRARSRPLAASFVPVEISKVTKAVVAASAATDAQQTIEDDPAA